MPGYFSELLIEVNLVFSVVPRPVDRAFAGGKRHNAARA
jgi:hypothetical protein